MNIGYISDKFTLKIDRLHYLFSAQNIQHFFESESIISNYQHVDYQQAKQRLNLKNQANRNTEWEMFQPLHR